MGTDYHRDTSDSIPHEGETRPVIQRQPPQGHYSAENGEWDGQLPHAEVATFAQNHPATEPANWPGIIQRMEWTRATIRAYKLQPPQAAVLNEIAYRDGQGRGCTATMETLALDTGYNEKSIRRAIKPLEENGIINAHGNPGQKKILGLPVKDGKLIWPAPVRESVVQPQEEPQPRTLCPGFEISTKPQPRSESPGFRPTPDTESGVRNLDKAPTPVRESGVQTNPGQRVRATPDTESDITRNKQEPEREKYNNLSHSLTSRSSGYPDRESGVQAEKIAQLVQENWELLQDAGWDRLGGAIRHYQAYGLDYLRRDLDRKKAEIEKASLAARTCVHCQKIHEIASQVKPCVRCEDPICESSASSCRQNPCHRKSRSRNRGRVSDWLQR